MSQIPPTHPEYQYLDLLQEVLDAGAQHENRTEFSTTRVLGRMMKFDMDQGFPLFTTKDTYFPAIKGELLGFIHGLDNAAGFRELGCNVWNQNANDPGTEDKPNAWYHNENRKGEDDLGRVYGVQARFWRKPIGSVEWCRENAKGIYQNAIVNDEFGYEVHKGIIFKKVDQLGPIIDNLRKGIDNRRLIVDHWNPGEMDEMALPPCHLLYQFGIDTDGRLSMVMYQRSCDMFLGVPFNVASYALLLEMVAQVVGLKAGILTHILWDTHIYENAIDAVKTQLDRQPLAFPTLKLNPEITELEDFKPEDIQVEDYHPHEAIKGVKMAT